MDPLHNLSYSINIAPVDETNPTHSEINIDVLSSSVLPVRKSTLSPCESIHKPVEFDDPFDFNIVIISFDEETDTVVPNVEPVTETDTVVPNVEPVTETDIPSEVQPKVPSKTQLNSSSKTLSKALPKTPSKPQLKTPPEIPSKPLPKIPSKPLPKIPSKPLPKIPSKPLPKTPSDTQPKTPPKTQPIPPPIQPPKWRQDIPFNHDFSYDYLSILPPDALTGSAADLQRALQMRYSAYWYVSEKPLGQGVNEVLVKNEKHFTLMRLRSSNGKLHGLCSFWSDNGAVEGEWKNGECMWKTIS